MFILKLFTCSEKGIDELRGLGKFERGDTTRAKNQDASVNETFEDSHVLDARNKLLSRPESIHSKLNSLGTTDVLGTGAGGLGLGARGLGGGSGIGGGVGLGGLGTGRRGEAATKRGRKISASAGRSHGQNLSDPSKIVVPTYSTLKANKMDEIHSRRLRELLLAETKDKDPLQNRIVFIASCVMATEKLARTTPTVTRLHKSLGDEFRTILKREMQENQARYMTTHPGQAPSLEDQSQLLQQGTNSAFQSLLKVLESHLTALHEFESAKQQQQSDTASQSSANLTRSRTPRNIMVDEQMKLDQYSKEAVWANLQEVCLKHLKKYLGELSEREKAGNRASNATGKDGSSADGSNKLKSGSENDKSNGNDNGDLNDQKDDAFDAKEQTLKKRGFFGRMTKSKKSTAANNSNSNNNAASGNGGGGSEANTDDEESRDEKQQDWSELTFSFADSSQKSIVQIAHEGNMASSSYLKGMREFAAIGNSQDTRRLSLRTLSTSLLEQGMRQNSGQNINMFDTRLGTGIRSNG
ncbi:hypothetical protein RFI_07814 [Reticulomyxa filosa]|uniref:Uncharacterized protein n=1 Tax=Reticulomyxa filosa TaxID=46433 RepID=X6NU45_RETFI|nr:hypothetical protein RFI_07814 [Reticulomyxa filosa]|eukprot:ETO29309.1 hypothetical protein RFI_07814 [Reticulomyxa filosa]